MNNYQQKPSTQSRSKRSLHLRPDLRGIRIQTSGEIEHLSFAASDRHQALTQMKQALALAVSISHRELDEYLAAVEA